ncbi:hypothetical protein F4823DRAFT_562418 [Ustulina deusta]|nr:hypothetical protein F4823DRAFT_562418 [Ustulina deusta]
MERLFLGEAGDIVEIVYKASTKQGDQQSRTATGVKARRNATHNAKRIIVATGAAACSLVLSLGTQVVTKSWSVAHVNLTEKEASARRSIPGTYARDLGFFFEPEYGTNLLKLCPVEGGFVNTDPETGVSHPSDYIIDYIPGTLNSIVLLSGDLGHGFKMFPLVGSWVRAPLEPEDGNQNISRWRWKNPDTSSGGNWSDAVSWRIGGSKEFRDIRPMQSKALL